MEEYAEKYRVCPFEMCLDMSLFADGIICDYNYVFDPHVYLKRFFADGVKGAAACLAAPCSHGRRRRERTCSPAPFSNFFRYP